MSNPKKSNEKVKRYYLSQKALGRNRTEFIVTESEKQVLKRTLKQLREQDERR